jgi:membrane protease YdiL (CAAX protease family)
LASAAKTNWTAFGVAVAIYLVIWGASVAYLARAGAGWTDAVMVFGIFGVALSGLAWLLTRGAEAPAIPVARPALESGVLLIYLALYAVVFLVFGMNWARHILPPGREQELLVLALKLSVHRAAPASFVWVALEAGLNEEFLYRAVLQTRLGALLKSPAAGVAVTALLFGLAHAPGLYLRGGPGVDGWSHDPVQVVAYTVATLSPVGVLFGVIYMRTKSLLLAVLLHGLIDVLPNLADFIRIWG